MTRHRTATTNSPEMARQKFKTGEKVLVPHTDKHYTAKVLRSELREEGARYYLLHYMGWNKKWDEWVIEADIQPATSVKISLPKKRDTTETHRAAAAPKKVCKNPEATEKLESPKVSRKRRPDGTEKDAPVHLVVEIPAILQKQLLEDYDLVTTQDKTVALPRKPNAMQILRQFYEFGKKELRCTNSELQMFVTGLEEYMDKTLEDFLLYESEYPLAIKMLVGGMSASSVYGAEHLLRLLLKLPELIPQAAVTPQQTVTLNNRLQDFLEFLVMHRHAFFANVKDYV